MDLNMLFQKKNTGQLKMLLLIGIVLLLFCIAATEVYADTWQNYEDLEGNPINNGVQLDDLLDYDPSDPGWYGLTCTLTYNANGGSVSPSSNTLVVGANYVLPTPTRTGYNFDGWFTQQTGGIQVTTSNTISEDTTIWAHWSEKTATLTYNNGGHGTAPSSVTMTYTGATNAASAISASGYTFTGWKRSDNNNIIQPGAEVKAANTVPAALTLTAVWATDMNVTPTAYNAAYDGSAHSAQISVDTAGATVEYGTTTSYGNTLTATNANTNYALSAVSQTNVTTTPITVYYRVTKTDYTTVTGSTTITITKANITPTVSMANWTYGETASNPAVSGNSGNGEVTYEYKVQGAADSTYTSTKPTNAGDYTVRATIAATANYNGSTATKDFTIDKATMTVTVTPYEGPVDGYTHYALIKGDVAGALVEFGDTNAYGSTVTLTEANTDYTFWALPRSTVGTTTIYYRISKPNYNNIVGVTTVKLSAAYAVLDASGNLTLFRSYDNYTNDTTGTFTDILGNTYTGRVFAGIETHLEGDEANCIWADYVEDIRTVRVATGQTIKPRQTAYWFNGCTNLTSCDLTRLDTSRVNTMVAMFKDCSSLTTLDISGLDTSNVDGMNNMFCGCSSLTSLDLTNFDTSSVVSMGNMFRYCSGLMSIDVTSFDTSHVTAMEDMFENCTGLTTLDLTSFDMRSVVTTISMFQGCANLETISWDTNKFILSAVTRPDAMFAQCSSLEAINVGAFDMSNATTMYMMFQDCSSLTTLDVENWNTDSCTSFNQMFQRCTNLETLDVSNWNTSKATNFDFMFAECENLEALDVSDFDTARATTMQQMFSNCRSLTELDVTNFDVRNNKNFSYMFRGCSGITDLDVSGFVTTSGQWFNGMFNNMTSVEELDVGNFNTSRATTLNYMFQGCRSLTELDCSSFDTSSVTAMNWMFEGCRSLEKLNVSSFDTSSVTNMQGALQNTNVLNTITLGADSIFAVNPTLSDWVLTQNGEAKAGESIITNITSYDGSKPGVYKLAVPIEGDITWVGDVPSDRPSNVTISLITSNNTVGSTTSSASDDWEFGLVGVKLNNDNTERSYSVQQNELSGYETTYNGYHITNRSTIVPIPTGVKKVDRAMYLVLLLTMVIGTVIFRKSGIFGKSSR